MVYTGQATLLCPPQGPECSDFRHRVIQATVARGSLPSGGVWRGPQQVNPAGLISTFKFHAVSDGWPPSPAPQPGTSPTPRQS